MQTVDQSRNDTFNAVQLSFTRIILTENHITFDVLAKRMANWLPVGNLITSHFGPQVVDNRRIIRCYAYSNFWRIYV